MLRGDRGLTVGEAGENKFRGWPVGGIGKLADILKFRTLLVVDGGDVVVARLPGELIRQLAPGVIAVVRGNHAAQGNIPLERQDLLLVHLGNARHIRHGERSCFFFFAGFFILPHPKPQRIGVVNIKNKGICAFGAVRAVQDADGDRIGIAEAVFIVAVCLEFQILQRVAAGKTTASVICPGICNVNRVRRILVFDDLKIEQSAAGRAGIPVEIRDLPIEGDLSLRILNIIAVKRSERDGRRSKPKSDACRGLIRFAVELRADLD